jgi:DUF971 family protein
MMMGRWSVIILPADDYQWVRVSAKHDVNVIPVRSRGMVCVITWFSACHDSDDGTL